MIKLSYDIDDYRGQILELATNGDTIIELGSHVGGTSNLILDNIDCKLIAIDNSPEAVSIMEKLDKLTFISGDVRLHETLLKVFRITQECDILAIDLGGGYHPDTVFKVFYIWSSTFKPKHTLIRNRGLIEIFNMLDNKNFKNEGYLESYHDSGIPPLIKEFELWTPSIK